MHFLLPDCRLFFWCPKSQKQYFPTPKKNSYLDIGNVENSSKLEGYTKSREEELLLGRYVSFCWGENTEYVFKKAHEKV